MNRTEFEALRDLEGKTIGADIRLVMRSKTQPLWVAEDIEVANAHEVPARLAITHNPETGASFICVHVSGTGPICRLDVDGPPHRPLGGSHKHSLRTERCPDRNLPDQVADMSHLSGRSVEEVFREFCRMANIEHLGSFTIPPSTTEPEQA